MRFQQTRMMDNISIWDTSNVTTMQNTFATQGTYTIPYNLSSWDTSKVINMSGMFLSSYFNNGETTGLSGSPIRWDTSKVTNMSGMFNGNSRINQPLHNWDTSKVTNMQDMFKNCTNFNQPLSSFNVSAVTNMQDMLYNCGMDQLNYDETLISWASQPLQTGVTLGANGLNYSTGGAAEAARTLLTTPTSGGGFAWTIIGDTGV